MGGWVGGGQRLESKEGRVLPHCLFCAAVSFVQKNIPRKVCVVYFQSTVALCKLHCYGEYIDESK